jgi:hypothetical protein
MSGKNTEIAEVDCQGNLAIQGRLPPYNKILLTYKVRPDAAGKSFTVAWESDASAGLVGSLLNGEIYTRLRDKGAIKEVQAPTQTQYEPPPNLSTNTGENADVGNGEVVDENGVAIDQR